MKREERLQKAIEQVILDNYAVHDTCEKIQKRIATAKNVCIYGVGNFYHDYQSSIPNYKYVCDKNPDLIGKTFHGKPCISVEELQKIDDVVVLVMVGNYQPICQMLTEKNIENYYFGDYFLKIYDTKYDATWFRNQEEKILSGIECWKDEKSKDIYVDIICNRIAPMFSQQTFHEMEESGEYYETGLLPWTKEECFVDAGAYDGDSILKFIEVQNHEFQKIYGFEFDTNNYNKILKNQEIITDERIQLFPYGVSDKMETVAMVSDKEGSHAIGQGEKTAKLVALDDVLKGEKVTFIKMDVEGAEMKALYGAKNILKEHQPKLAISVYHKLSDLWEVPLFLKEINPLYELYLRHHTAIVWDTDCYAVSESTLRK